MTLHGTAVTAGNIVFEIDPDRDGLDSDFAKLPPCKIEKKNTLMEWNILLFVHIQFLVELNGTTPGKLLTGV